MESPKFPRDPILLRLLTASQRLCHPSPMIHDVMGFTKGYPHLLGDILATRQSLLKQLPKTVLQENELLKDDCPYIFLLCRSGYEYLVGFFAIRALGGAVMPLAPGILGEEAGYFQMQTKASCLLFGKDCQEKVSEIYTAILERHESTPFISCRISTDAEPQVATEISIDDSKLLSPRGPGIVFLTSGTTGPPKAAVLPRESLAAQCLAPPGGAGINFRPGHWIGGADTMIMPILAGQSLHCIGQRATPNEILQAFADHRITHAIFGAPLLSPLKNLITGPAGVLSEEAREKYNGVFRGLSTILCGGGDLEPAVREFWVDLTGVPIENFYATTETGARVCSSISKSYGCIGVPIDGVEMKLSKETVGEICIRAATAFTHYIGDEVASRAAFDEDGFLRTGDLGKYEDGQYYILGREKIDYVRFRHFDFPTAEVERALLAVSYIAEACVVGVPLPGVTQLCGAVIRVSAAGPSDGGAEVSPVSLREVRRALQDSAALPSYKLPFLLRVLEEDERLPLTHTGKIAKGEVLGQFFGREGLQSASSLPAQVEVWGAIPTADEFGVAKEAATVKAWDWCGLQNV